MGTPQGVQQEHGAALCPSAGVWFDQRIAAFNYQHIGAQAESARISDFRKARSVALLVETFGILLGSLGRCLLVLRDLAKRKASPHNGIWVRRKACNEIRGNHRHIARQAR
jgi:hypothetical protein